jgi:hypothetical protein
LFVAEAIRLIGFLTSEGHAAGGRFNFAWYLRDEEAKSPERLRNSGSRRLISDPVTLSLPLNILRLNPSKASLYPQTEDIKTRLARFLLISPEFAADAVGAESVVTVIKTTATVANADRSEFMPGTICDEAGPRGTIQATCHDPERSTAAAALYSSSVTTSEWLT